ncbi:MAG: hypothetical protein R2911_35935 [Caldilineaceae bacterium]
MRVTIPPTASMGERAFTTVTVTSLSDPGVVQEVILISMRRCRLICRW